MLPRLMNGTALSRLTSRFSKDEDGNIALLFAFCLTMITAVIGASVDYRMLATAEARSQQIGDSIALSAAVYVRNQNGVPGDLEDGGIPEGRHTAAELGYEYSPFVWGGDEGVNIDVTYDDDNRQAIVDVSGVMDLTFSKVLLKESGFKFNTRSVVSYEDVQINDAASIVLVLDNSGSMNWDDRPHTPGPNGTTNPPQDAVKRIDALKDNVVDFMAYLEPLVGDQSDDKDKLVRTGMLAYNSATITSRTQELDWRFLDENTHIEPMVALGGTNSAPPMDKAREWMLEPKNGKTEDQVHLEKNGKTPLKFVIFMTDGVNDGDPQWYPEPKTNFWRSRTCKWTYYGCSWSWRYETSGVQPASGWQWKGTHWEYHYTWEEGRLQKPNDRATLADCDALKRGGVTVYTIGFALEPGTYEWNGWYNLDGQGAKNRGPQSEEAAESTYGFLQNCASEQSFFVAANADELTRAFDTIGQDIVQQTIRIKS